ncbi:MAG TPA: amidohydrolase [Bacteroidales bacterium]|nr:amidohydrolase [Bacteroidales bacterium]
MQDLRITMVQSDIAWEQTLKNLDNFGRKLEPMNKAQDIVVLPEMFATGFTMNVKKFAEDMNGTVPEWMRKIAATLNCVITGSFIYRNDDVFYNRLVWMRPDGSYETYDKKHLFRFGNEHNFFTAGTDKIIIELKGWNICPMICYDLRFPAWAKNTYANDRFLYDVLIYIANWPEARKHHWEILLKARAVENLCYVVGVNRVGRDGRGTSHSGNSMIISPKGKMMGSFEENNEAITTVLLDTDQLIQYRKKFNVALDWDNFLLQ